MHTVSLKTCLFLVALALLVGACGRSSSTGPTEADLGIPNSTALLWEARNNATAPLPMIILCALGSEPSYWAALASRASNEGYRVLVCPAPPANADYAGLLSTAQTYLGHPRSEDCIIVGETAAANAVLAQAASNMSYMALIFVSAGLDGAAENYVKRLGSTPLLLAACENDTQGATAARALKDAATGYCEIQSYACGVRGADLLAAAPNFANQVLAWLKPIVKADATPQ